MSQIKKKFIGDNEVGAAKVRLENNSSIKARNAADNADVNILKVNATDELIVEQNFIPVTPNTTKLGNDNKAFGEVHVVDIKDGTGGAVISTNTRVMYDTGGNNSVDADSRILIDSTAVTSVDYQARSLKDATGENSVLFNTIDVEIVPQTGVARKLMFWDGNYNDNVAIRAPLALGAGYILTLPSAQGGSNTYLKNNGSGGLSWDTTPGITVEDEATPLTTAVTKFNFSGSGVTVTEPVANEILVTIPGGGSTPGHQLFTLSAGDITNGYVTLTNAPIANSVMMFVSGLKSTFTVDYTVSGSQVNFSTHTPTLVATDVVEIHYQY